jgi:hypothetical protein
MRRRHDSQRYFDPSQSVSRLRYGLVAHYLSGGSGAGIFDYSGYQNASTFVGDTAWTVGPSHRAAALKFDGTGDYSDSPISTTLDLTTVTMSAWVYSLDDVSAQIIVGKAAAVGSHTDPFFSYALQSSGTTYRMWVATGGAGTGDYAVSLAGALVVGTWNHVAGTHDGANILIYVNGMLQGTTPKIGALAAFATPLRLAANGAAGELFTGSISDVRVYNRVLSDSEIYLLANPALQPMLPTAHRNYAVSFPRNGDFNIAVF